MKIVILDCYKSIFPDINWHFLDKYGDVTIYDVTRTDQVYDRCLNCDVILLSKTIIDDDTLERLVNVKYIGYLATGFNTINIDLAKKRGIIVTNIPNYSTASISQIVFSYILYFANRVDLCDASVKKGEWERNKDFCYLPCQQTEIAEKTIGIIGFGNIGKQIAKIALGFSMKVLVYSRSEKSFIGAKFVNLDELLHSSDYVSINVPLNESTEKMVDLAFLKKMKSTAVLINTSRGKVINETNLDIALNKRIIFGAALDVLSIEPPINNCLLHNKWTVITPHCAWGTFETVNRMLDIADKNINAFINKKPINVV